MKDLRVAVAPPSSPEPAARSLVASSATTATCMLLLASCGSGPAIGSLRLEAEAPFRVRASSLRLPATGDADAVRLSRSSASTLVLQRGAEMINEESAYAKQAAPEDVDECRWVTPIGCLPRLGRSRDREADPIRE